LAVDELKEGHKLTAGEHLVRAGIYYHFGQVRLRAGPRPDARGDT